MSAEHKAALAAGRNEGRAVRQYLEALHASKPKRGRKRTAESIERRLGWIEENLEEVDRLTRLNLVQERMNLQNELASMDSGIDLSSLEDEFVSSAASYSDRRGISYAAWRELGVEASVLRRAGISRSAS